MGTLTRVRLVEPGNPTAMPVTVAIALLPCSVCGEPRPWGFDAEGKSYCKAHWPIDMGPQPSAALTAAYYGELGHKVAALAERLERANALAAKLDAEGDDRAERAWEKVRTIGEDYRLSYDAWQRAMELGPMFCPACITERGEQVDMKKLPRNARLCASHARPLLARRAKDQVWEA